MVKKQFKTFNGHRYQLYRTYGTRKKAEEIAERLKIKGIRQTNGQHLIYRNVRITKENYKRKDNVRPFHVWGYGKSNAGNITRQRQRRTKRN